MIIVPLGFSLLMSFYAKSNPLIFTIYRAICDVLEGTGCFKEAIRYFIQMQSMVAVDTGARDESARWEHGKRSRTVAARDCLSIQPRFSTAMHRGVREPR